MTTGLLPIEGVVGDRPSVAEVLARGLVHDASIDGCTLDEVSVVRIADRAVVVPIARSMAAGSGFELIDVGDDVLRAIGIADPPPPPPASLASPVAETSDSDGLWADDDVAHAPDSSAASSSIPEAPGLAFQPWVAEPVVEAARPLAVVPASRPQWATMPNDPAWPDIDRRINDRRDLEVEAPVVEAPVLEAPVLELPAVELPAVEADMASSAVGTTEERVFAFREPAVAAPTAPAAKELPVVADVTKAAPSGTSPFPSPSASLAATAGSLLSPSIVGDLLVSTAPVTSTATIASLQRVVLASAPGVVLNLEIRTGEFVVVSGPSNAGKTSLLRVLAGMDGPLAGRVVVNGEEFQLLEDEDRRTIEGASLAFVAAWSTFVPDLTVVQNVEIPLLLAGSSPSMARGATTEMLFHLGLGTVMDRPADRLSTSELRLACVTRALITQPSIVIADDPTSGLDRATARFVLAALQEAHGRGATIVMASSDARLRLDGPRHLRIDAGALSEQVSTS